MGRLWSVGRFTPLVLFALLLAISAAFGGGVELLVLLALLLVQAVVLGVPLAAGWAGRQLG
jgi:hypothetical protein